MKPASMRDQGLSRFVGLRLALFGAVLIAVGLSIYGFAIVVSLVRLAVFRSPESAQFVADLLWYSGLPTSLGAILVAVDLFVLLPGKRRHERRIEGCPPSPQKVAVALMSYNDEASIGLAVRDFIAHPMVATVIVVDNNSKDRSAATAAEAGAVVVSETRPGYGSCVYRCLQELHERGETDFVVLCEGDMTFRARDVEKLATLAPHGDIVNGTRIVEQLRAYHTQITTRDVLRQFLRGEAPRDQAHWKRYLHRRRDHLQAHSPRDPPAAAAAARRVHQPRVQCALPGPRAERGLSRLGMSHHLPSTNRRKQRRERQQPASDQGRQPDDPWPSERLETSAVSVRDRVRWAADRAPLWALLLFGFSGVALLLVQVVADFPLLGEAGYGDSYILYDVEHFRRTGVIHRDLSVPPYPPAQYSPLVYMVLAVPARVLETANPFLGPRVVILLAFAACVALRGRSRGR